MGQPVKNFCFLAEVPHLAGSAQLWPPLGGSGPQAPEVTQAQIDFLRQQGITGVISASGWGVPQDMLDASGLSLLRLDVPDFCSPSLSKVRLDGMPPATHTCMAWTYMHQSGHAAAATNALLSRSKRCSPASWHSQFGTLLALHTRCKTPSSLQLAAPLPHLRLPAQCRSRQRMTL